jgi:23S rRNA pseudouridine1911/1915/1917 synthase
VLHEDPDFMVFNKPVGVLVVGPDSLEERLRRERGEPALAAAHRLDKDTTGCVLFARNPAAWDTAAALFRERKVLKLYHAIAQGDLRGAPATVNQPIDGQEAVTHFRVLDANRLASHLQVKLETGRTHQVRRHLEALGHPLAGDRAYGTNEQVRREFQAVPRQMLHAARLEFVVPGTGCRVRVEAALPPDFRACLKRLRLR